MENILRYSRPAEKFIEALMLGNGTLGAMVYGGIARDHISLNHDRLWSGMPRRYDREGAYEAYLEGQRIALEGDTVRAQRVLEEGFTSGWSQAYLPMGDLYIESDEGELLCYKRELDLEKATVTVNYATERGEGRREYFISAPDSVLAFRYVTDSPVSYKLSADSQLRYSVVASGDTMTLSGIAPVNIFPRDVPKEEGKVYGEDVEYGEGAMGFTFACRVFTDGEIGADGDKLCVMNARTLTVMLAADTGYIDHNTMPTKDHAGEVARAVEGMVALDYSSVKERHVADFSSYYNRVKIDLCAATVNGDTNLRLNTEGADVGLYELLFNMGRYLTISASRAGSRATTLQGIWNEELIPPWQSNYTVNINTEMNYWPTLMCNLVEFNQPIVDLVEMIADTGRQTARHFYHADGFVSHHNIDIWGMSNPVGINMTGSASFAFWSLSSGWLCAHLYRQYEYTLDKEFLAKTAYPLMKEAAKFYLSVLIRDENGKYILCPSTSPENNYWVGNVPCSVSKWTMMSQMIIANLFRDCLESAAILGEEDEFVDAVRAKYPELQLYKTGSKGQMLEWDGEFDECDPHHRHCSFLYGLCPGELITTGSTPDLAEACAKSLELRGDEGTGWGLAWKVNFWAKLKDGDRALRLIDMQLKPVERTATSYEPIGGIYPNMFDAHPPFQIDGNFGATAGIAQLFLQCEDGVIRVLPALPSRLRRGIVKGLLAKGNVTVDIEWNEGKLTSLTLMSPISQTVRCSVADGESFEVSLRAGESVKVTDR